MDFLLLSIISIITLINPVGIIPTYLNIIENFDIWHSCGANPNYGEISGVSHLMLPC